MKILKIGDIPISRETPFLILEAGVNHEGSLSRAFEMIDEAAQTGAQMIKFQSYKADTLASKNSPAYWDRSCEPTESQYKLFQKYDAFGNTEYVKLAERCREKGILFGSTPFDLDFVDSLDKLMPIFKIASADITNLPLLNRVAMKNKPILLSTGAAYLSEIEEAVRILRAADSAPLALMHCILEYPAKPEHANLNAIPYLKSVFPDHTIGWSDHVPLAFNVQSLNVAWMLGADILEKHFTLDKTLPGNDHYHAMNPDDVRDFLSNLNYTASLLGRYEKNVLSCEMNSRKYARRSLVAVKDLEPGTIVQPEMLTEKRPGTGISPTMRDIVIGKKLGRSVKKDNLIEWNDFGGS